MGISLEDPVRAAEMYRLRVQEGLTLRQIGERYGVSKERVRQIVNRHLYTTGRWTVDGETVSERSARVRAEKDLAAARAQSAAIIAAWRDGGKPHEIAQRLALTRASVRVVIEAMTDR